MAHLRLRQPQFGRQVSALRQRKVLGLLEALVERLQLQAGVDGAGFADLLAFAIQAYLPVFNHSRLLAIFWRNHEQRAETQHTYC